MMKVTMTLEVCHWVLFLEVFCQYDEKRLGGVVCI